VDRNHRVVGLTLLDEVMLVHATRQLGDRLWQAVSARASAELTRDTPKPMLKVGSRPLLETMVRTYSEQGFRRFYLAVNYKAEQIEARFDDGSSLGVDIRYLREEQRMGTAGAFKLATRATGIPIYCHQRRLADK